jgi:hypothetical protein
MMGVGFNDDGQVQGIFDRLEEDYDEDVPTAPLKRSRNEEIQWSEIREFVLVSLYFSKKAYIKTKTKMEDKKLIVFNEIKNHSAFIGKVTN